MEDDEGGASDDREMMQQDAGGAFTVTGDFVEGHMGLNGLFCLRNWVPSDETKRVIILGDAHAISLEDSHPGYKVDFFTQSTPALMGDEVPHGVACLTKICNPNLPEGVSWPTIRGHFNRRQKVAIASGPGGVMVLSRALTTLTRSSRKRRRAVGIYWKGSRVKAGGRWPC